MEKKVSRTPIREVLRRLEAEGLATFLRFKGFVVNSISIEDMNHIYTIKASLEGLAGRLCTPIISTDPEKMETLQRLCSEMQGFSKRNDVEAYSRKNIEFHAAI